MDDLSGAIAQFLSQPEAMEQLGAMAKQLGLGEATTPEIPEGISPEMLTKLIGAVSEASRDDEVTELFGALRGLLRPERQEKIDRAIRAVHLVRAAKTVTKVVEL